MKQTFLAFMAAVTLIALTACTSGNKPATESAPFDASKCLVLYYSQNGSTQTVAETLQTTLGVSIEAIEVVNPYDGTYDETIARVAQEREQHVTPDISPLTLNPDDYDVIFLGFPIWFGTYAPPIASLVDRYQFEGKKIVPFCTFGSGGLETAVADLRAALPLADVLDGYGVRAARLDAMPAELECYLMENKFIPGEVAPMPDYSEMTDVEADEAVIFDAACGDYMYPLGTPISCGKRTTPNGTDYKFKAKSVTPDGNEQTTIVYVTISNDEGATPVFTKVVR